MTPSELVEILQRTVEEQGSAFMNSRTSQARTAAFTAAEFERIRADRRLREEQDDAYNAALLMDKVSTLHRIRKQQTVTSDHSIR